jgi:hypothetical protein
VQTRPRFTLLLDTIIMLSRQSPSRAQPAPLKRIARGVLLALVGSLLLPYGAGSAPVKEYVDYKTYALYLLDWNKEQHICLLKLYGKESAWNPTAVNGSHYGIPQGRSEYLARVDGYKQVEWGLSYIHHHRIYQGDTCKAWQHWKDYNWH